MSSELIKMIKNNALSIEVCRKCGNNYQNIMRMIFMLTLDLDFSLVIISELMMVIASSIKHDSSVYSLVSLFNLFFQVSERFIKI